MQQNLPLYYVDVCLCIDGTSSMYKIINKVKAQAKNIYELYGNAMIKSGRGVGGFRVRVIVFRDYKDDGENAMVSSEFFDVSKPDQLEAFEAFVDNIEAVGGGDIPENALEAIALALRSDWTSRGAGQRRHAIMVFTDATALPLQDPARVSSEYYPEGMPMDLPELHDMYDYGDQEYAPAYCPAHGRLVIFAPEEANATWKIVNKWERTWLVPTTPNGGCDEIELEDALALLCGTL